MKKATKTFQNPLAARTKEKQEQDLLRKKQAAFQSRAKAFGSTIASPTVNSGSSKPKKICPDPTNSIGGNKKRVTTAQKNKRLQEMKVQALKSSGNRASSRLKGKLLSTQQLAQNTGDNNVKETMMSKFNRTASISRGIKKSGAISQSALGTISNAAKGLKSRVSSSNSSTSTDAVSHDSSSSALPHKKPVFPPIPAPNTPKSPEVGDKPVHSLSSEVATSSMTLQSVASVLCNMYPAVSRNLDVLVKHQDLVDSSKSATKSMAKTNAATNDCEQKQDWKAVEEKLPRRTRRVRSIVRQINSKIN